MEELEDLGNPWISYPCFLDKVNHPKDGIYYPWKIENNENNQADWSSLALSLSSELSLVWPCLRTSKWGLIEFISTRKLDEFSFGTDIITFLSLSLCMLLSYFFSFFLNMLLGQCSLFLKCVLFNCFFLNTLLGQCLLFPMCYYVISIARHNVDIIVGGLCSLLDVKVIFIIQVWLHMHSTTLSWWYEQVPIIRFLDVLLEDWGCIIKNALVL